VIFESHILFYIVKHFVSRQG